MNRSKLQSPNRRVLTVYGSCFFNRGTPVYTPTTVYGSCFFKRGTPVYTPTTIVLVVGTPEKRTLVLETPRLESRSGLRLLVWDSGL